MYHNTPPQFVHHSILDGCREVLDGIYHGARTRFGPYLGFFVYAG